MQFKQKPKWLFFDLGSTLIDETEVYAHRFRETVCGARINASVLRETAERFWAQGLDGYPEACRFFQLSKAPWRAEFERPFGGCAAVLGALKERGYQLGVIANQIPGTVQRLTKWDLLQYFDVLAPSAELGMSKPDPAIFLWALREARCDPKDAVMIGDRIDNDVLPAKALGMRTVHILTGPAAVYTPTPDPADAAVHALSELLTLF